VLLLIQRWYYPIDPSRKNEYGTSALDAEVAAALARGEKRTCRRGKYDKRVEGGAGAQSWTSKGAEGEGAGEGAARRGGAK
jgi:hypothetical protein